MKRIFNLLLFVGALTLLPGVSATPRQSSPSAAQPQASTDPQTNASNQTFMHSRHHRRHSTTRHHRGHKTSTNH